MPGNDAEAFEIIGALVESQKIILGHMEGCPIAYNFRQTQAALISTSAIFGLYGYIAGRLQNAEKDSTHITPAGETHNGNDIL